MKFDVIKWMTEHGHPGYGIDIATLTAAIEIFTHDGDDVPPALAKKIEEIRQMAQDRYDDWATDIDYE